MADDGASAPRRGIERKWLILAAVMLGTFMGPLDGSIVNTINPKLRDAFNTDISIVQWVPTIYLLTISCLILLYGRLGDMVGHKRIFITGLAAFTVASALCGASQSIWMLIAFRGIQGLAAGMTIAVSFAIVTAAFPPQERGRAMGIYAISIAVGLGLGPTLGGLLADHSWRYVFYVNVPIGIAAVLWGQRIIPRGAANPGQRLDWAGAAVALVFLLSLLLFANRGEDWGWLSESSIALIVVAIVFGAVFVWIERRSGQPMLNLALFKSQRFSFAALSAFLSFMALYAVVFLTPFYLFDMLGYSILKVGLVMAASPVATLFVAPLSGALSDRIGTRIFAFSGMVIAALGLCLLSGLDATFGAWDVIWRLIVVGVGMGMFQSPNNSAVMGSVPPWHLGIASGILAAMRNVGMVLGLAVGGAVLYNVAPVAATYHPQPFTPAEIQEYLNGLQWAFISGASLAGLAALTSLFAVSRKGQAWSGGPPPGAGAPPGPPAGDA
jgi:EmrB/QacA subfamily drug resistance transporter